MRIYSNKILSWNEVLHSAYISRIMPNVLLNNRRLYKIIGVHPAIIHTYSPIEFLEKDIMYYTYQYLIRDKSYEHMENSIDIVERINNKPILFHNELRIYLPFTANTGDIIVLYDEDTYSLSNNGFMPVLA